MKSTICFLFVFSISLTLSFAQGEYLYSGQSGFGASGGMINYYQQNSFYGKAGYSFKGVLDIGLSVRKSTMENMFGASHLDEFGIAPYIQLHLVKQDQEIIPFTVSASASIDLATMESDKLSPEYMKGDHRAYEIGLAVYHTVDTEGPFGFQPMVKGVYRPTTVSFQGEDANETTLHLNHTELIFGFGFLFATPMQQKVIFQPSLALTDQGRQFAMSIGFVLPDKMVRIKKNSCYNW